MALRKQPELDCPKGHELVRPIHRRPGHALFGRTLCPYCERTDFEKHMKYMRESPVCATTYCKNGVEPGQRYCPRCLEELEAIWKFVRERHRKAAA